MLRRFTGPITPVDNNIRAALLLDTAEKAAQAFMNAWKARHWPAMQTACTKTWKAGRTPAEGERLIEAWFGPVRLLAIGSLQDDLTDAPDAALAGYCRDFFAPIYGYIDPDRPFQETRQLRVIQEVEPYQPGSGRGSYWGVDPRSALRSLELQPGEAVRFAGL